MDIIPILRIVAAFFNAAMVHHIFFNVHLVSMIQKLKIVLMAMGALQKNQQLLRPQQVLLQLQRL